MANPKRIRPVMMPIRVPPDVKARLEVLAAFDGKSLNQTCVDLLEAALKRRKL